MERKMQLVASGLGLKGSALQVSFYTTYLASTALRHAPKMVRLEALAGHDASQTLRLPVHEELD